MSLPSELSMGGPREGGVNFVKDKLPMGPHMSKVEGLAIYLPASTQRPAL